MKLLRKSFLVKMFKYMHLLFLIPLVYGEWDEPEIDDFDDINFAFENLNKYESSKRYQSASHLVKTGPESRQGEMTIVKDKPNIIISDKYRLSLSIKYQFFKSIAVTSSNASSNSLIKIQSWATHKDKLQYPLYQVRSADYVILPKPAFIQLMHFMFSNQLSKTLDISGISYVFTKHFEGLNEYPHMTILQVNRDLNTQDTFYSAKHTHRGVVLDMKEYFSLLNRISQLLYDMDSLYLTKGCQSIKPDEKK